MSQWAPLGRIPPHWEQISALNSELCSNSSFLSEYSLPFLSQMEERRRVGCPLHTDAITLKILRWPFRADRWEKPQVTGQHLAGLHRVKATASSWTVFWSRNRCNAVPPIPISEIIQDTKDDSTESCQEIQDNHRGPTIPLSHRQVSIRATKAFPVPNPELKPHWNGSRWCLIQEILEVSCHLSFKNTDQPKESNCHVGLYGKIHEGQIYSCWQNNTQQPW